MSDSLANLRAIFSLIHDSSRYVAANARFAFPDEDRWAPDIHTPPHGVPAAKPPNSLAQIA